MTASSVPPSEKAELFAKIPAGSGGGKRLEFFDRNTMPHSAVVNAEQYCEYPQAVLDSGVDLHAFHEGTCEVQPLYADPEGNGLSLGCYTFPPNFTFPRHHHDSDQIVFVVEGSLSLGNKVLQPGAGYFTRAGATYSFTAGPAGVRILEFRPVSNFRTVMVEDDPAKFVRTDLVAN
jgi:quercetin dioxygenase-like cupin family protein